MFDTLRSWHQYLDLLAYPHLLRFCIEKKVPISKYSLPYSNLILKDIVASGIPTEYRSGFKMRRGMLNECLRFGYRHKLLDKNRSARLKGKEPGNFWSLISELKTGVWLERQDTGFRDFEPPSAGGGLGDYLIEKGRNNIFIEVKTLFGERDMLEQEHLAADFAQYCQVSQLPVTSLNILHYPRAYAYAGGKDCLFKAFEKEIVRHLPLSHEKTIVCNKNGISIEILLSPGALRVVSRGYVGFFDIRDALGARTRRGQISEDCIPSVLIIDDFNSNVKPSNIEAVLYGTPIHDETVTAKAKYYREKDGLWSCGAASELNSVFILRFEQITTKVKSLDAYLCPVPKYELVRSVFSEPKLVWRKLDEAGVRTETVD